MKFASALILALFLHPAASNSPAIFNETCPGCVDQSAQPTVSATGPNFDVTASITNHSGACWYVNSACVMSYPCTPYFAMQAWATSNNQAWCSIDGIICGNTVSIDSVNIGASPSAPRSIYRGYVSLECGVCCGIDIDLVVHYNDAYQFYSCPVDVLCTLLCTACG